MKMRFIICKHLFVAGIIGISLSCDTESSVQPDRSPNFIKLYGGANDQEGIDVEQTGDGGFILGGTTTSGSGGSHADFYLVKTDSLGNEIWSRTFDIEGLDDEGCDVQVTPEGYVLCGTVTIDETGQTKAGIVHTDEAGQLVSGFPILVGRSDSSSETAKGIIVLPSGDMILAGSTTAVDTAKYDPGEPIAATDTRDFFWAKVSAGGEVIWQNAGGFRGVDEATGIAISQSGVAQGIAIAGHTFTLVGDNLEGDIYAFTISSTGSFMAEFLTRTFNNDLANGLAATPDGGYILLGTSNDQALLLYKLDRMLNRDFSFPLNTRVPVAGVAIKPVAADGYILSATTRDSNPNIYLLRTDATGNSMWEADHGHTGPDRAGGVIVLEDGRFAITGTTAFGSQRLVTLIKTDVLGGFIP